MTKPWNLQNIKEKAAAQRYILDLLGSDGLRTRDAAGVEIENPAAETLAYALRNRAAYAPFAAALKAALGAVLDKRLAAGNLTPDAAADLRAAWVPNATPEGLAAWVLDPKGWGKVNAAKLEADLPKAWPTVEPVPPYGKGTFRGESAGFIALETKIGGPEGKPLKMRVALWKPPPDRPPLPLPADLDLSAALEAKAYVLGQQEDAFSAAYRAMLDALGISEVWIITDGTPPGDVALASLDGLRTALRLRLWEHLALGATGPDWTPLDPPAAWLRLLAGPWLQEAAERADRQAAAVGIALRPKAETDAGKWTPLPRALTVAAALGGPFAVEVDGETYAPEPELAGPAALALRPRGVDIVPADWLGNPAQLTLALDLDTPPDAVMEYMGAVVESATRTAHLAKLGNICPKLLGLMFACAPMTGRMVQGTLGELARMLYPDWTSNRRGKRDLEGLGLAMMAAKGLRLVETEPDGTRRPYELFIVDMALTAKPDAVLGWTINPWLLKRMQGGTGGGFFLINMTRWLALEIKDPGLFPLALRLAALWDGARVHNGLPDPARLRPIEADRLAWECNTLPEGAAMFRAGKTDAEAGKVQLKRARANLEADLDALREAGLLGPWKKTIAHGRGFDVLPVPPADYAEACKRAALAVRQSTRQRARSLKR